MNPVLGFGIKITRTAKSDIFQLPTLISCPIPITNQRTTPSRFGLACQPEQWPSSSSSYTPCNHKTPSWDLLHELAHSFSLTTMNVSHATPAFQLISCAPRQRRAGCLASSSCDVSQRSHFSSTVTSLAGRCSAQWESDVVRCKISQHVLRDKINRTVKFGKWFLRVPLVYKLCCLVWCCQGRLGELAKKFMIPTAHFILSLNEKISTLSKALLLVSPT